MKRIEGLAQLIDASPRLAETGWIFVADREDLATNATLVAADFLLADDDEEEIDMEDEYSTFVENHTFQVIVEMKEKIGKPDPASVAEGCLYYLEFDTFQDELK